MLFSPIRYINNGEPLDQETLNRFVGDIQVNLEEVISRLSGLEQRIEGSVQATPNTLVARNNDGTTHFSAPTNAEHPIRLGDTNISAGRTNVLNKTIRVSPSGVTQLGNRVNFFTESSGNNIAYWFDIRSFQSYVLLYFSGRVNCEDYFVRSDIRDKENLIKIEGALDKVEQLNGYHYHQKNLKGQSTGVIAQEVEQVLPELILYDEEADRLNVQTTGLIAVLIESVKELSEKVKTLEKRLEEEGK